MYIKEIIIDGFKSYAQRTVISGFDPQFNAITGLNGSGKSNILDSICFVLGITNLSHVRAHNLQELVYKNGQAGINKATVSIVFDNSDRSQSPLGYEDSHEISVTRQIVVGGRNKYLINGVNAQNQRVHDLFQSVSLNVNNPHFLIMQGRITKVLNMKPPEILSMVEEAAGTKMYEAKRSQCLKAIADNETKLHEIDRMLKDDIEPTMERLKGERAAYMEFQKVNRELEHLTKFVVAFQYVKTEEVVVASKTQLDEIKASIDKNQKGIQEKTESLTSIDATIAELEEQRDAESGGKLQELEAKVKEAVKLDAVAQSTLKTKQTSLKAEQKGESDLRKNIDRNVKAVTDKTADAEQKQAAFQAMQEEHAQATESHKKAEKNFQAVQAGLSTNEHGDNASLQEQLMKANEEVSTSKTDLKKSQDRLQHAQGEVRKKRAELKKTESTYNKDKALVDNLNTSSVNLEDEMNRLGVDEATVESLGQEKRNLTNEIRDLSDNADNIYHRYPDLSFRYTRPSANFDDSQVKGLVAKSITVKDPKFMTAVEVASGGKLRHVIVNNEQIGKQLIERGRLERRTNFIPLNKIQGHPIAPQVVERATRIAGGHNLIWRALDVIEFDESVRPAMEWVFGGVFICANPEVAKRVCFDKSIMKTCVTLEGDNYNPGGTLSGGARQDRGSLLSQVSSLAKIEADLTDRQNRLAEVSHRLGAMTNNFRKYQDLKGRYELKQQEGELARQRLEATSHHQLMEDIKELEETITSSEENMRASESRAKEMKAKADLLQDKIKNAAAYREKELKAAESRLKEAKKSAEAANKRMTDMERQHGQNQLEIEELQKETVEFQAQLEKVIANIAAFKENIEDLKKSTDETKQNLATFEAELSEKKEWIKAKSKEIGKHAAEKEKNRKDIDKLKLKIGEHQHNLKKREEEVSINEEQLDAMIREYPWIKEDRESFGQPQSFYDFKTQDPAEAQAKRKKLGEKKDTLLKTVNQRAMATLGEKEEQFADLKEKRVKVMSDKIKIQAVIRECDDQKNDAIGKACEQVNVDFGQIFSTLLAGTNSKLVPIYKNNNTLEGLEIKVSFGDVWKESLTELSGGQRSLVALSLILSLLRFKPAPLYILDEVDAALDLSHTQNIGQIIKQKFKNSQFVIVSLKDNMFNNANVLFRTKFVDGVSMVQRFANQKLKK